MEKIYKIVFFTLFFCLAPLSTKAATLFVSPSSGEYTVGKTFSVSVFVSSADQAANAVSGTLSFPKDKLEVTSISKSGSIISFWVQEPSYSNSAGTVNFEGVKFNPGFTGSSGKIMAVTFKVKAAGSASVVFSSSSVLANDGKGTNILTGAGSAKFNLTSPTKVVEEPVKVVTPKTPVTPTTPVTPKEPKEEVNTVGSPATPQVSSVSHPDPNKWYSTKTASFLWNTPTDVSAVRLLVDANANSIPSVVYAPAINEKELVDLTDGIWYFHVQSKNDKGWGEISHFRFQVDITAPEQFSIKFNEGNKTENPRPVISFNTKDALSGIDYYKIKIGEGDFFQVSADSIKNNSYTLPIQKTGKRNVLIYAFDKAGNYSVASEEFVIEPLIAPVVTKYPQQINKEESLIIGGTTKYPNSHTEIWLELEGKKAISQIVKNDADGNFSFTYDGKLDNGTYKIWAQVFDDREARSNNSEVVITTVTRPAFYEVIPKVSLLLIAIIILLILIIIYILGKYLVLKKRLKLESHKLETLKSNMLLPVKTKIRRPRKKI